jgi:peptidoglycan/xylan/chitin deacetylase (PgdA/CDA1 family)
MREAVRFAYSPIIDRRPIRLPGGARVAVWVVVNVELWDIARPLPRTLLPAPGGGSYVPDVTNYGWYDYGLRVGFWRLREVLNRYDVPATLSLNGAVCTTHPRLVEAALESRWEFLAHGYLQRPLHQEEREREVIHRTAEAIAQATGRRPRGWLSPGLGETWETLDHLAAEGFEYVADWANDDQPYEIPTATAPLVAVPYSLEINDIPMFLIQHHPAEELLRRSRDQFDTYYREGERGARIMAIAVHPYITGVPHRIGYLERVLAYLRQHQGVLFWTGSQIVDWYREIRAATGA